MGRIGRILSISMVAVVVFELAMTPGTVHAATFTVNSLNDWPDDHPGDGICRSTVIFRCTLRAAIMEANVSPAADTITLPAGTLQLTVSGLDDAAALGDLDVTEQLSIQGAGSSLTIVDASRLTTGDRVFDVRPGPRLTLTGLRITGGKPQNVQNGDAGGGVRVGQGSTLELNDVKIDGNQAGAGGGIFLAPGSSLSARDSTIDSNSAVGGGGGIHVNDSTVNLHSSTISRNRARNGGGLLWAGQQLFVLDNTTVSTNTAQDRGGGLFFSLSNAASSELVFNATIAFNTAPVPGAGGNIFVSAPSRVSSLQVYSSIVAKATRGGSCGGQAFASGGFNLDSENTRGFTVPGDLVNTDPKLGPLRLHNSQTEVHPLPFFSPAVDAIPLFRSAAGTWACDGDSRSDDQRHVARPQDGNGDGRLACDIGAYELIIT